LNTYKGGTVINAGQSANRETALGEKTASNFICLITGNSALVMGATSCLRLRYDDRNGVVGQDQYKWIQPHTQEISRSLRYAWHKQRYRNVDGLAVPIRRNDSNRTGDYRWLALQSVFRKPARQPRLYGNSATLQFARWEGRLPCVGVNTGVTGDTSPAMGILRPITGAINCDAAHYSCQCAGVGSITWTLPAPKYL